MKISISKIKPNPINEKIYDNTELSTLTNSLEQYGLLEPIVVNKKNTIISGHRRYYSALQLDWKNIDVIVKTFESDVVALIQYNEQRQKSGEDYNRERQYLLEEQKKLMGKMKVGKGGRIDLVNPDLTNKAIAQRTGKSETSIKQEKTIQKYEPKLFQEYLDGDISRNNAYNIVKEKHLDRHKDTDIKNKEFVKSFRRLLKKYQPNKQLILDTINQSYPYNLQNIVSSDQVKKSNYDTKRQELIDNLEMLKKLNASQELLLRKEQEISNSNFDDKIVKKLLKRIWTPTNLSNIIETTSEIEKLNPVLEIVGKDPTQFVILRKMISAMTYVPNPGRHIRVLVKDKPTGKYLGVLTCASDFTTLSVRDNYIGGWDKKHKFELGRLNSTMIGSTIVPTQPLGYNFLGGKLMACLITSKKIRDEWEKRYGDVLVGATTTSLYGNFSQYDGIPIWKNLGETKGTFLRKPTEDIYLYWLDFVKEHYKKEYDEAIVQTSPKDKVLQLIFKVLGLTKKDYQVEFQRGVYFSEFYKNTKDYLLGECTSEELLPTEKYYSDDWILDWWKVKAIKRYINLHKSKKLQEDTLWFSNITKKDIKGYLATTGIHSY